MWVQVSDVSVEVGGVVTRIAEIGAASMHGMANEQHSSRVGLANGGDQPQQGSQVGGAAIVAIEAVERYGLPTHLAEAVLCLASGKLGAARWWLKRFIERGIDARGLSNLPSDYVDRAAPQDIARALGLAPRASVALAHILLPYAREVDAERAIAQIDVILSGVTTVDGISHDA